MPKRSNVIDKMSIELSLEAQSFSKQMTTINKEIKNTEKEFKSAGKGVKNFESSFTGLDAKIQKASKQIDLYNIKLTKQKSEYEKLESVLEKQKSKLNEIENTLGKGSKEWQQQAQLVQKNSEKLSKLGTDIKDTEGNINRLENELKESQQAFEQLGNKTKSTGEKLADIDNKAELAESEFNRLSSELERNGTFFQKLGNEMNQLSSKIDASKQKVNVYESAISKLESELKQNKSSHEQLASEIKQTEQALSKAQNEYGKNSTEAQKLKAKLLALKDSYNQVETEIEQNTNELNQYQVELNQTQTEVNQLANELRQLPFNEIGDKLKDTGGKIKSVGQGLTTGVTVPITAAGVAATIAGTNFDTSMSKLQATSGIAEKTSESYIKLKDKALEMGSSTSFSASEAADGLTYLALAGWDVETQIERIEPVLRAAEAGGMGLATASDKITDSMSSASVKSKDFAKYLDIVAQAQRKSNTSMEQMLDAYVVAGGIFNSLNMPLEESGALLGVLANRGTKGSEAGNALISVFSNLITETGQAGKALDKLNISLYDGNGKQRNMVEVLKEMAQKLGVTSDGTSKLTEKQKQQYAAMVGGKTQFDTLMKLLAGVSGEYDELHDNLVNSNGSLNEMATIMKDNLGGQMESMKSAIEGSLIKAFKAMEPVISKVVELITDAANWFSSLDEEQQKNIVTMAAVVAALGPILMGIGQLIIVGGNAVTLFGGLSAGATAATGATTGLTGALGVLASPIGILGAVAALVGLMTIVGDSEKSILALQEKFGGLGYVIGAACEFISGTVQLTFGNLIIIVQGAFDTIAAIMDGPGGQTVEDAQNRMYAKLTLNTEEAWMKITNTTSRGLSQMRAMNETELRTMISTTQTILNQIPSIVDGDYNTASAKMAHHLKVMSDEQLLSLTGMNDTTKMLFQGINSNMTVEEMSNQVSWNMKQMSAAGELEAKKLEKDITSAMNTLQKQVDSKTKQASQNADTNTKNLANKVDTNSKAAATSASKNANKMKNDIISATKQMANQAISDWNRIRNEYSRNISGRVNITKTTTNVVRTQQAQQTMEALDKVARVNVADYQLDGAYYRSNTKVSTNIAKSNINLDLRKIEKLLEEKEERIDINLNFNFDKVEIKTDDDYKKIAKKIASYVDVELQKIKNKNRKINGRLVNA